MMLNNLLNLLFLLLTLILLNPRSFLTFPLVLFVLKFLFLLLPTFLLTVESTFVFLFLRAVSTPPSFLLLSKGHDFFLYVFLRPLPLFHIQPTYELPLSTLLLFPALLLQVF